MPDEISDPKPADSSTATPDALTPSERRAAKARKWRRRLIRFIVVIVLLVMAGRALVHVIFPPVLSRVAGLYGLKAEYTKLDLYMFGGDLGLWGLRISPAEGGKPLLTASYVRGSVSLWALLRGHLHVERAEAEDADLTLERTADGKLPLLEKFLGNAKAAAATPATQPASATSSFSLDAPLTINTLRLQNARAHLSDQAIQPATDLTLALDLLVSDIGSLYQKTHVELQLTSPEALGVLSVQADGQSRQGVLQAEFTAKMYGLNLLPAKPYLAPLGLVPTDNDLQGNAAGDIEARVTPAVIATATQPAQSGNLSASVHLHDLLLTADSATAASVKSITVEAPSLISRVIHVAAIDVDGMRLAASRTHEGRMRFAGIELVPVPPAPATQPIVAQTVIAQSTNAPSSGPAPAIDLDRLTVSDTQIEFVDAKFDTPNRIAFNVPKLQLEQVSTDPAKAADAAKFWLHAGAPGLAKAIDVHGTATPAAAEKSVDVTVSVSGIQPTAAAPYLSPLGVTSTLTDGSFKCHLIASADIAANGVLTASLKADDIELTDGGTTLFAMPLVDLQNASINPTTAHVGIGAIRVLGPTLPVTRDTKGLAAMGFVFNPPKTSDTPTAATANVPTTNPSTDALVTASAANQRAFVLPTLTLDAIRWQNADITFVDRTGDAPLELALKDLAVEGDRLVFDSSATDTAPGLIKANFSAPGIVERMDVEGTVAPKQNAITFDIRGVSSGITADRLKPLLRTAHIEPVLKNGLLKFTASGSVHQQDGAIASTLALSDVALQDGDQKWLSLGSAKIDNAAFDGKTASIESIAVDAPALQINRDDAGLLTIAGIKLLPVPPQAIVAGPSAGPSPTRVDLSLPIVAKINSLRVNDATIALHDEAVLPITDLSAIASVSADKLVAGADAPPSPFSLTLSSPGVIESMKVNGHLLAAPAHQAMDMTAEGTGVSGQALEPYLPPNIGLTLHGGTFGAKVATSIEPNPAGGSTVSFSLTDAALNDGHSPQPLGAIGALRLDMDRVDLPANVIAIKEVAVEHAQLGVQQDDKGVSFLGVNLASVPLRPSMAAPEVMEAAATTQASNVAALTARARAKPPLITLQTLSLGADRLSVTTSALAAPLVVTNASLKNTTPIELLGDRPSDRRPFDLQARATVADLIDSLAVDAHLAPFAGEPNAKAVVNVDGIHGDALINQIPKAGEFVSADDLKNGKFTTTAEAQFGFTRSGAFGIDMTRDITARFDVTNTALTDPSDPKTLAGVDSVHGEGFRFSPANGSVVLKLLEITKPAAHIVRDAEGIHAFGLTIKTPTPSTQPATQQVAIAKPTPRKIEVTPSSAPVTKTTEGGEARIDRLTVSGIDVTIEDRIGKPATIIPINQLDVDVAGLSTRALTEPNKPIRFNAIVGAGKVELPPRDGKGGKDELREVFTEASASGNITLVPKPNGYIKSSLSGLEMTAIRGLASEFGVTLGGGTFDSRIDVRMNGGDSFVAKVFPTFNQLRMKEVPNGPVQSFLQLPAPPDVVISTLEDTDGSISFPVEVPINAGKLDTGAVVGSAVGAVGKVVAEAMLAAPLKAAKLVAMLGGADVSSDRTKDLQPVSIDYAPGESQLSNEQLKSLQPVLDLMKGDDTIQVTIQHTLGTQDIALAEQRANPLADDTRGLADSLRRRKFDLQRQVSDASVQLRVALATADAATQTRAADQLRSVSTQLKENGDDLDQVLELMRPGAQRQAERRTRTGAILLGDLRMRAVRDAILASKVPDVGNRIRQANALFNPGDDEKPGAVTLVLTRVAKS